MSPRRGTPVRYSRPATPPQLSPQTGSSRTGVGGTPAESNRHYSPESGRPSSDPRSRAPRPRPHAPRQFEPRPERRRKFDVGEGRQPPGLVIPTTRVRNTPRTTTASTVVVPRRPVPVVLRSIVLSPESRSVAGRECRVSRFRGSRFRGAPSTSRRLAGGSNASAGRANVRASRKGSRRPPRPAGGLPRLPT